MPASVVVFGICCLFGSLWPFWLVTCDVSSYRTIGTNCRYFHHGRRHGRAACCTGPNPGQTLGPARRGSTLPRGGGRTPRLDRRVGVEQAAMRRAGGGARPTL